MENLEEDVPVRGKITKTFGEVTFNSNFDSGNLDRVVQCPSSHPDILEFNLWTAPDCAGTPYQNSNRSWFYFSVITSPNYHGKTIKMHILNLNKQVRLYQQGFTPLIRTVPGRGGWERMRDRPECQSSDEGMVLSFHITPPELRKSISHIAFCYPFSYSDCQRYLTKLEQKLLKRQREDNSIYYHRDLLCYSLDGLRIDLITVSSNCNITTETEPHLPGLFPDRSVSRAQRFHNKKVILITSRVHPGETPSSYVFNGILDFLLREDDPRSQHLREQFVFKLVPMLNPDGVARGHYRTDSRGINLNRVYLNPSHELHPPINAIRSLMLYYCNGTVLPDHSHHYDFYCECAPLHGTNTCINNNDNMERKHVLINNDLDSIPNQLHVDSISDHVDSIPNNLDSISSHLMDSVPDHIIDSFQNIDDNEQLLHTTPNMVAMATQNSPSGVALYVDLHAHATKRGCFIYGNHFDNKENQVECMLLPKLVSLNSAHFDFGHSVFSERNMYMADKRDGDTTKEGSGRVALYKATGLIQCYTLECNYNSGRHVNTITSATMDSGRCSPPQNGSPIPHKLTSLDFEEVGRGLVISILDLYQINPWSRLPTSEYATLHGVRQHLLLKIEASQKKAQVGKRRLEKRRPLLRSNTDESDIDDPTLSLTTCLSSPSNPLKISHKIKLPKRDSNEGTTPSIRPPHYVLHIQEDCYKVKKLEDYVVEQHSTYTMPNPPLQSKPIIHSNSDSLLLHKSTFPTVTHTTHRSLPSKLHLPLHPPVPQRTTSVKTLQIDRFALVGQGIRSGRSRHQIPDPLLTSINPIQKKGVVEVKGVTFDLMVKGKDDIREQPTVSPSKLPIHLKSKKKLLTRATRPPARIRLSSGRKGATRGTTTHPSDDYNPTLTKPLLQLPLKNH